MRGPVLAISLLCTMAFATTALAELPTLTKKDIASFSDRFGGLDGISDHAWLLRHWQDRAKAFLKSTDLDGAARKLAPAYGFTAGEMHELLRLWLLADKIGLADDTPNPTKDELHATLIRFVQTSGYKPLAVQAAAMAMAPFGKCSAAEFDSLVRNAPDPIAIGRIAMETATCPTWDYTQVRQAPDKSFAPLMMIAQYTGVLDPHDYLALYEYLLSDSALTHVAPRDRAVAHAHLAFAYCRLLWDLGLTDRGITYFESLPPGVRSMLLDTALTAASVRVDGLPLRLETEGGGMQFWEGSALRHEDPSNEYFRLLLAGAYFTSGRKVDAERVFSGIASIARNRAFLTCVLHPSHSKCSGGNSTAPQYILLDFLLHHPQDDPYDLAEAFYSSMDANLRGAIWTNATCEVFAEPQYADLCRESRKRQVDLIRDFNPQDDAEKKEGLSAIRLVISDLDARRATFRSLLDSSARRFGYSGSEDEAKSDKSNAEPLPPRFAALPLPEAFRGIPPKTDNAWMKLLSPLPRGFAPVRVERKDDRVVAISLSQNYDPTGEVSGGGYWVHLSDDGGKTWQKPLYTGLAEFFPYEVLPASKMPLFDGNTLNVVVDIKELDQTSITYPPIALRSKRKEGNLYVKIPIAELERNGHGTGLTAIAEEHLLLGPVRPGLTQPALIGRTGNAQCDPSDRARQKAVGIFLERWLSLPTGAIIEPVDRDITDIGGMVAGEMAAAAKGAPNSEDRPVFIEGNPKDFSCLRSTLVMIVYSDDDIAELRRMTPDFHALSFGAIVFNRAHDRGYFKWSTGWAGGTERMRLVNGEWKLDQISSWIT
jgi:hypothetical protein